MSEPPAVMPTPTPPQEPAMTPPAANFKPNTASQTAKDCPVATAEAAREFTTLVKSIHTPKSLGLSWQEVESMICDCSCEEGVDSIEQACGEGCINRLTQVECLTTECRCGSHCLNQRFTKREYANISVIKTERKGYGLRAESPLTADQFIYEYVGEVVEKNAFMDRMKKYGEEGIRHFYFMELQKDEYIDATRKGGIGRFANHSCNPNCYVAKWVVGKRMRMGIFAKRDVAEGEELTFNYNVDRYGHEAQPCYCDEPNCVGSIGGKTQTDVGGMDDLFLDALGITAEVEAKGLKGSKRKKALKLGEDYTPTIFPIEMADAHKVVSAVRQATSNRAVLCMLLQRMKATRNVDVQRRLFVLHGFGMMAPVLKEFVDDAGVIKLCFEEMELWPLLNRAKVEAAHAEDLVKETMLRQIADEEVQRLGNLLLVAWAALPQQTRLTRILKSTDGSNAPAPRSLDWYQSSTPVERPREELFQIGVAGSSRSEDFFRAQLKPVIKRPAPEVLESYHYVPPPPPPPPVPVVPKKDISSLLAEAIAAQAESERKAVEKAELEAIRQAEERARIEALRIEKGKAREKKRKRVPTTGKLEPKGNEAHKEKRLLGLVGEVVVKSMSKYKDQMDHEKFKEYAKQCAQLIVAKEKKSASFITVAQVPPLTEEKAAKMKKFTKEYAHRVLKKLRRAAKAAVNGETLNSAAADEALSREVAAEMAADDPEEEDEDDGDDGEGEVAGAELIDEASAAKISRLEADHPPSPILGYPLPQPAALATEAAPIAEGSLLHS